MHPARDAWNEALALLVPVRCAGCGRDGLGVCTGCRRALRERCRPVMDEVDGVPCASAIDYAEPVPQLLHSFKERGRADVAGVLAPLLRAAVAALALSGRLGPAADTPGPAPFVAGRRILVVPAPSRRSARTARGYDHIPLLIERALPNVRAVAGLRLHRRVADQAGLGVGARARNLRGAMVARPALAGAHVLIVDDVRTSGATVREAIRAVREAGGNPIGAAVVSAVTRRGKHRDDVI